MNDKIVPVAAIYHWLPDGTCKTEPLYSEADVTPLRDMLIQLEWCFNHAAGVAACPLCEFAEDVGYGGGHAPDCALAALLERIR